jgi:hypothetical protein
VAVTTLRPAAPVVLLLPPVHRSALYGGVHRRRSAHVAALRAWAAGHGVVTVETAGLVAEHVLTGRGNPDGIHWGWPAHGAVGETVAAAVAEERDGPSGGLSPLRPEQAVVPIGSGVPSDPQALVEGSEETAARS